MGKNNPKKSSKMIHRLNYYEATGSAGVNSNEANAIVDKSMDAVSANMLKNKAEPNK